MDATVIVSLVAGLALLAGAVATTAFQRNAAGRTGLRGRSTDAACVFCHRPVTALDPSTPVDADLARRLLGRPPSNLLATAGPDGAPRWLAHLSCATAVGAAGGGHGEHGGEYGGARGATESDAAGPGTAESDAARPGTAEPGADEPSATEPSADEPSATEPGANRACQVAAAEAGRLTCPLCRHRFTPPAITVATREIIKRYGGDPVRCPRCHHIWNGGRQVHNIRR